MSKPTAVLRVWWSWYGEGANTHKGWKWFVSFGFSQPRYKATHRHGRVTKSRANAIRSGRRLLSHFAAAGFKCSEDIEQ